MAHFELRLDEARLAVARDTQHRHPVQQLAPDIARPQHAIARRLLEEVIDPRLLEISLDRLRPFRIGHAERLARVDPGTADLEREAAAKPAVILVGSDKGGVGKTTITTLLDCYELRGCPHARMTPKPKADT